MEADDLLCSRNAGPEKALVGRAQWKITQPPIPEEIMSELGPEHRGSGRSQPQMVIPYTYATD